MIPGTLTRPRQHRDHGAAAQAEFVHDRIRQEGDRVASKRSEPPYFAKLLT
jgi:hypothetical protein